MTPDGTNPLSNAKQPTALPQTGNKNNELASLGLLGLSTGVLMTLLGLEKKRHED
ncbi:LPXTG cell wall anchor domain-containing protein [Limosilactobacillus caecicola]|uniref:LPXTG cell wall anchor domain-containing protein n=1 Tax=Limosilactobacillus caecicola TaxID=2941332 RepID=UPI0038990FF6